MRKELAPGRDGQASRRLDFPEGGARIRARAVRSESRMEEQRGKALGSLDAAGSISEEGSVDPAASRYSYGMFQAAVVALATKRGVNPGDLRLGADRWGHGMVFGNARKPKGRKEDERLLRVLRGAPRASGLRSRSRGEAGGGRPQGRRGRLRPRGDRIVNDDRTALLAREIESRWPGTRVEMRPCSDEEDPAIRAFLWILDVPVERLCEVEDFAIGRAFELYGDEPLPFHVSAASPETTAKHFPAPAA
jgi:hypothetical protein